MSQFLHDIIHSLSARERAYFKRFSKLHGERKDKHYLQLFDALLEMPSYDIEKLKEQFSTNTFSNRITSQLAYLNEQLLKSLSNYYLDSSPNFKLQKFILFIELLNSKGYRKQSLRMLNKAKKLAYSIEDFTTIIKLIQIEEEVLFSQGAIKFTKQLEKLKYERIKLYDSISNVNELRLLLERIRDLFFVKVFDIKDSEYDKIFNNPILLKSPEHLCVTAKKHWFYCSMWKYFLNLEFDKALENCVSCLKHMNQHHLIFSKTKSLPILSNLLMLAALSKNEDIFKENYEELHRVKIHQPKDEIYIHYIKIVRFLEWTYQTEDADGTIKYILDNKKNISSNYKKMEPVQSNHFLLLIVRAYIDVGQFNDALDWHNRLIESGIHSYTLIHTRIFSLIIHLEFGWLELLESEVESVKKTLKKQNKYNLFARTFIDCIKKILKNPSKEEVYLTTLSKQLVSMKSQQKHNKIFIYVKYDRWCKQRLYRIKR